jgi:hypothetical protein
MNMKNNEDDISKKENTVRNKLKSPTQDILGFGERNISQLENFLGLLKNHPYLRTEMARLWGEYNLDEPFSDRNEYRTWKYNLDDGHELKRELQDIIFQFNIVSDFLIQQALGLSRKYFAYFPSDLFDEAFKRLIATKSAPLSDKRGAPSSRIMLPSSRKDAHEHRFKENGYYIEVNEWTTKEEVKEAYDKISDRIPDVPKDKNTKVQRFVWVKREFSGWSGKKVAKELCKRDKYPSLKHDNFVNLEEAERRVGNLKRKYKNKLNKLKTID